jgi:hypothetical protein
VKFLFSQKSLENENTETNKNNNITFFATVNCLNITKLTSFLFLK